ncbi:glycosyltransferase [Candidatus Pelagisphaera phototrophica]|uniref:glycosyltransferase n=1 Tax=Candidatus Pelagisphaera phototrophica TaxID=2684113 RepID=UPI0024B65820|nr:glycosyltransferase [Candidatus Pelagisphaera phototrophica]QXD32528.1 glycosyltransferase [Candidatus Pelagisphaera phototrophica]
MQLIVLGMHRSGTSALGRILNMMGAYFGDEGSGTGANEENPKGFWERRDVRELNDDILNSADCDWNRISAFEVDKLSASVKKSFKTRSAKIILEMDGHRPWFLKEPRLCLLFELWKDQLEIPIVIHIYRNPIEVAQSLYKRNKIPNSTGIALWEKYNSTAFQASIGKPRIIISHRNLMIDPIAETSKLYNQLNEFGVPNLRMPSKRELSSFIQKDLYRQKFSDKDLPLFLTRQQTRLFREIKSEKILHHKKLPEVSTATVKNLLQYEESLQQQEYELSEYLNKNQKSIIVQSNDRIASLKIELTKKESQRKLIKGELDQSRRDHGALKREFKALGEKESKARIEMKQVFGKELESLKGKLGEKEVQRELIKGELDQSRRDHGALKREFKALGEKESKARIEMKQVFGKELESLKGKLGEKEVQRKLIKGELDQSRRDHGALKREFKALGEKESKARIEMKQVFEKELELLKGKLGEKEVQRKLIKGELDQSRRDHGALKREFKALGEKESKARIEMKQVFEKELELLKGKLGEKEGQRKLIKEATEREFIYKERINKLTAINAANEAEKMQSLKRIEDIEKILAIEREKVIEIEALSEKELESLKGKLGEKEGQRKLIKGELDLFRINLDLVEQNAKDTIKEATEREFIYKERINKLTAINAANEAEKMHTLRKIEDIEKILAIEREKVNEIEALSGKELESLKGKLGEKEGQIKLIKGELDLFRINLDLVEQNAKDTIKEATEREFIYKERINKLTAINAANEAEKMNTLIKIEGIEKTLAIEREKVIEIGERYSNQEDYFKLRIDEFKLKQLHDLETSNRIKNRLEFQIKRQNLHSEFLRNFSINLEQFVTIQKEYCKKLLDEIEKLANSNWKKYSQFIYIAISKFFKSFESQNPNDYIDNLKENYLKIVSCQNLSLQSIQELLKENIHSTSINYINEYGKISLVPINDYCIDTSMMKLDIVVCVHNALEDVKNCLESIKKHTHLNYFLYIVDDGSDIDTQKYLQKYSRQNTQTILITNEKPIGYTKSANIGLRASTADYVILLNSDTIVTPNWGSKLIQCGERDTSIGIIGPLSNAASWQSIPERYSPEGDWMVNEIPSNMKIEEMGRLVSNISKREYPKVALLNGFCFAIKRRVIESIGFFDEESFPQGYGEENDYCFRAVAAGYQLAIADDTYIFHAKSKSFTHEGRRRLAKEGGEKLKELHGKESIDSAVKTLRESRTLGNMRKAVRFSINFEEDSFDNGFINTKLRVLFLLPVSGGGGGVHSIVQETIGIRKLGRYARIAVPLKHKVKYQLAYPNEWREVFHFYDSKNELFSYACNFNVVVATIFTSVKLLSEIIDRYSNIIPAYYIQDYEPWIVDKKSELYNEALNSYNLVSPNNCFAKTKWLCDTLMKKHNVKVHKIKPSVDHNIYYCARSKQDSKNKTINICAMIRPKTPRRNAEMTMKVLSKVKNSNPEFINILIFGCDEEDPFFKNCHRNFDYSNYGHITREGVSKILRKSHIFLDLSVYQAFGRTGLEAMACGCVPVLPKSGGVYEYAISRVNAAIVDTNEGSENEIIDNINSLLKDRSKLSDYREEGIKTAKRFTIEESAWSEIAFFEKITRNPRTINK